MGAAPPVRSYRFDGGTVGRWRVVSARCIAGEPIAAVSRVAVVVGESDVRPDAAWSLRGIVSNERYVARDERRLLVERQAGLGRADAKRAALIPIRKTAAWWSLAQDERRAILEEESHHIAIGMDYLPAIARRLHHCRDLTPAEPFDFLTWFEYAAEHEAAFDRLVAALRASPEWSYVDREMDIRLVDDA